MKFKNIKITLYMQTTETEQVCANCQYWMEHEGGYRELKDLYTLTEPDHDCDEEDIFGTLYFLPNQTTNH